jgi:hypothetical protein
LPKKDSSKIVGACFVKVETMTDLGRLSCAYVRAPLPLFQFREDKLFRLAAQVDLFMGTPIFYYFDGEKEGEFVAYRNSGDSEEVQLMNDATNPTFLYAPIIRVKKMPEALRGRTDFEDKFLAVEVEDLASLIKVGAYSMNFEEPPLPLYTFKNGSSWVVGAFARIDDYEEASLFFYTRLPAEPISGFVKFSPSKTTETAFTKKTDEHGFVYIKVIRLAEKHPLVQF